MFFFAFEKHRPSNYRCSEPIRLCSVRLTEPINQNTSSSPFNYSPVGLKRHEMIWAHPKKRRNLILMHESTLLRKGPVVVVGTGTVKATVIAGTGENWH